MANFVATKDTGELLFDTNRIVYGLVKSGYMSLQNAWSRRTLRSAQLDPNNGANWTESAYVATGSATGDDMYGFTISGAVSPIVFIVGSGCLQGQIRSGDTITFMYSAADANTRYYCFDTMRDNIAGSPFLKTWDVNGVMTFNSLQPPLNVIGAVQPPGPPAANDAYGRKLLAYDGGYVYRRKSSYGTPQADCIYDIALTPGVEYAAFLPWSRICSIYDQTPNSPATGPMANYSVSEGAYGRIGGVSFVFGAAGGTTMQNLPGINGSLPVSYVNIPVDRIPQAIVISTAGLPFPFG